MTSPALSPRSRSASQFGLEFKSILGTGSSGQERVPKRGFENKGKAPTEVPTDATEVIRKNETATAEPATGPSPGSPIPNRNPSCEPEQAHVVLGTLPFLASRDLAFVVDLPIWESPTSLLIEDISRQCADPVDRTAGFTHLRTPNLLICPRKTVKMQLGGRVQLQPTPTRKEMVSTQYRLRCRHRPARSTEGKSFFRYFIAMLLFRVLYPRMTLHRDAETWELFPVRDGLPPGLALQPTSS